MRLDAGRIFGLDLMRASAIALVLLSHTALFFPSCRTFFGIGLLAGYFGVELFFVLSGFLIGGILLRSLTDERSTTSLGSFWRRRWLRTLPNYFLFLFANVAIAASLQRDIPSLLSYPFFFQNVTSRPPAFFVESWSLAVEEWFYVLMPILFFMAIRISRASFRASSLLIICSGIFVVTLARSIYVLTAHPVWLTGVRMIVVYRLDACMVGVLAAWAKHYYPDYWQRSPRFFFGAGVAVLTIVAALPFVLTGESLFLHTAGFTLTSFGALLLLPMLDGGVSGRGRGASAIVNISIWSYSLYLVNLPVHTVLKHFCGDMSPFFLTPAYLFSSIMLAALIYRFYEKPIMNLRGQRVSRRIDIDLGHSTAVLAKN